MKSHQPGVHIILRFAFHFCATAAALLVLAGCLGGHVGNGPIQGSIPSERLRHVDPIDLGALSTSRPQTKEETQKPLSDLIENGPPKDTTEPKAPKPVKDVPETPGSSTEPQASAAAPSKSLRELVEPARPAVNLSPISITLEEARISALANNLSLQAKLVDPSIAAQSVSREQGRFDATFSTSASFTDTAKSGRASGTYELKPELSVPLATGGIVTIDGSSTSSAFLDDLGKTIHGYSSAMNVGISQPLLKGAGFRVNTAPIHIARLQSQSSEAQTKLNVIRTLAQVESAYWEVEAARREVEIQRSQLETAEKQLENVEKLITAGFVIKVERIRAVAGLLAQREGLVVAETNLRLRERDLKQVMNRKDLKVDEPRPIICATRWEPLRLKLDPQRLVEIGMSNRMDLAAIQVQLLISDINTKLARNGLLPGLRLFSSYSRQGDSLNRGESYRYLINDKRSVDDYTVGASLSFPIGNRTARANLEQSKLEQMRTLASREELTLQIQKEILDAVDGLNRDWERIVGAQAAVRANELNYKAEFDQFLKGVRTSTEVLDASRNWASARSAEVRALADYANSKVAVALATGNMLGYSQVLWTPRDLAAPAHAPAP